ncbi:MAG: LemA family protein [Candidatus Saccharimonadales bacterium]
MKNAKTKKFPVWGIVLIVVGAIVAILAIWGISTNNRLVGLEEGVTKDAAQIETQLQRRVDLIPNLVNTVKGYAGHETEIFTAVADARTKLAGAISDGDVDAMASASSEVDSALGRLIAIAENYPDLKANTVFIGLQDELAGTENRINQARQTYNDSVADYNKSIKVFPANIIAGMGGFDEKAYFEAADGADEVPEVEF